MLDNIERNKLNIYLIKSTFKDYDSITEIGNDPEIKKVVLGEVGIFYYKPSLSHAPEWLVTFFNNHPSINPSIFFGSGTKAVLISKIINRNKKFFFAIPFGSGRFLLKDNCIEERFGLITSLNLLEAKSIRALDKRTLSTNPKNSREQIAKASEAVDFQIDFEKDLLQSITGKSLDKSFGNIVTGKEALRVSAKVDISNLSPFLHKCLNTYEKKDYQINFGWIDQISEIKIPELINKLNEKLLEKIRKKDETVWLAVPDLIDWEDFKGFKYSMKKKDPLHDDLEIEALLDNDDISLDELSFEDLENKYITCWCDSKEDFSQKWSYYSCLNAEIDIRKHKYFLSNSKWYEIDTSFVNKVNKEYATIKHINLNLPDYNHPKENDYNLEASRFLKSLCLDGKNLSYGGGHSKIEFCDILTLKKDIIHVKKYGGSSVLSHLFNQGFVSAELFISDIAFREKLISECLPTSYRKIITTKKPVATQFKIIFAIITKKKKLNLPFFSKVSLKNHKRILEAYGFKVFLSKINNSKVLSEIGEEEEE